MTYRKNYIVKQKAIHRRIETLYGKPKYCEICKRSDKKKYEWANKDHKYSMNIEDWMRLCTSCHRKYDIKHNNYSGFWWNSTNNHPMKKVCE